MQRYLIQTNLCHLRARRGKSLCPFEELITDENTQTAAIVSAAGSEGSDPKPNDSSTSGSAKVAFYCLRLEKIMLS